MANGESDHPLIRLAASIELAVGRLTDQLRKTRQTTLALIPKDVRFEASGTFPASGPLVLALYSPDLGRIGQLRSIFAGGTVLTTAVAGTCNLYVAGSPPASPQNPTLGMTGARDNSVTPLPAPAFYSTHQVVIQAEEWLYAVITGGTVGQVYSVSGQIEDYNARAFRGIIE